MYLYRRTQEEGQRERERERDTKDDRAKQKLERVLAQVRLNLTATEYEDGTDEGPAASASCCLKSLYAVIVSERSKRL